MPERSGPSTPHLGRPSSTPSNGAADTPHGTSGRGAAGGGGAGDTPGGGGEGGGATPPGGGGPGAGGDDFGAGHVVDLQIERELQDSYLTYAMSTIMDRALPDVRDGLKPSQRRILVAMNDLNLRPGRKHLKCAKICGDTSGNYHPHGEGVIYPTLVGLAQGWKMRARLVDPQGNFGSIQGDPPAAMRYTEARMTQAAVDMLEDLELSTVAFQPNYDDRLVEPTVLPGKFPNLLINGGVGIAVGMATSMAPHNPAEVFDSIVRLLDNPAVGLGELMQDVVENGQVTRRGIKGPDFPTGGIILGRAGIVDAYATGRGRVTVRGVVRTEETPGGRTQIVIDSIPFGLVQNTLMERLVEAVREERITEVSDVRDESGREARTRVVIELKRGADPAVVENQLYEFTPLQMTFSINSIALVNRQPRTLSLLELLRYYIEHRGEVIRRRTNHLLTEAKKKAHVLEGMIYAVCEIDEVIALIRSSQTRAEAIGKLMARAFRITPGHRFAPIIPRRLMEQAEAALGAGGGVALTRVQAETIGGMRLLQLVGLEIERLVGEYAELVAKIEDYEDILARPERVTAIIRQDCEQMRARYGAGRLGERQTRIEEAAGDINLEALIAVEDMTVTISRQGYAKRVPSGTYRQQGRGGKGVIAGTAKDDDFIEHVFVASTHDDLLCFTTTGRVFKIRVYELPELPRQSKGRPLVNLLDLRAGERTCAYLAVKNFEESSNFLTFVSRDGIVKRTPLKEYRNVHRGGLIAAGLKEGDELLDVTLTDGNDDLLLVTAGGMAIRFNEQDVRLMGRAAAGVKGIELGEGDRVIGVGAIRMRPDAEGDLMTVDAAQALLTITEHGYGKRTLVDEYRVQPEAGKPRSQSRGGKGRSDIATSERNGRSVAALVVRDTDDAVVVTRSGLLVRMPVAQIRCTGRAAQGVRVVRLEEGDAVVAAARLDGEGDENGTPAGEAEVGGADPAA
ncbi:MAG TPA: DNA gyrase subunit A [Phycisphaerales bacterium]|nr:DNA gyrase subunit A [Phycisphaerales bacterium]